MGGVISGLRADRWRWARVPALAAGLLLIERALIGVVGTPTGQLRAVRRLAEAPTDPVTPMLAVLGVLSQALIGYVLVVLAMRSICLLPGPIGRLASRVVFLVSPAVLRRLLDLLVGGTMLAQATLAVPGALPGLGPSAGHGSLAASVPPVGTEQGEARPTPRRLAAPLPPWLEGGPSKAASSHTVEPGDTLWDIAAARLAPGERSSASVHRYWRQIYRANRPVIGADPNLIAPGMRLDVPAFRDDRR